MKSFLKNIDIREWLFQSVFLSVLFLLYAINRKSPTIETFEIVFFSQYVILALFIGYVFIPKFFYTKKYVWFTLSVFMVILVAYVNEEYILEPIFFKNKRGEHISSLYFTLLEFLPLIITMVSFKLAWDAIKKQSEVEQLQLLAQESELRFLKSQINPHFLFNNLNNLYSYAIENSPKTPNIILELSSVLRYMLYDCKEDFVPLIKEINHLKHFTALNELQIENRGKVTFTTSDIPSNFKIAPLILLMFIENAFKHSTSSQSDNIFITITIDVLENGQLNFNCKNSFLPNTNNQSLSKGIGLENVKKRLQLLYPDKHKLTIATNNTTFEVNLVLQLQKC